MEECGGVYCTIEVPQEVPDFPEWFKGFKETEQDIIEVLGLETESLDSGIKKIVHSTYRSLNSNTIVDAFDEVKQKLKSVGVEVGRQLKSFQVMASGNPNIFVVSFEFMPIQDIVHPPKRPVLKEIPTEILKNV